MPQVLNKHRHTIPAGAIFIGRPGPFGNPFVIGKDGNRATVIAKYRAWLLEQPTLLTKVQQELRGKDLVCFCAPCACHGDILLEIANAPDGCVSVTKETKPNGQLELF